MAPSGSPTVRRRQLATELHRLRGNRSGIEVSRGVGWSTTKISRAESGRESFPPSEVEKIIDYYGVTGSLRGSLLELAEGAAQRGWWENYDDVLRAGYKEFIGLEAGATATLQWQSDVIPGLLQTEDYADQIAKTYQRIDPATPPAAHDRFLHVRATRQQRLTSEPAMSLSVVIDEAVLLRRIGPPELMRAQLARLVDASQLPHVELRVLPLEKNTGLVGASFAILNFSSSRVPGVEPLGDIVSTESLNTELYVEGDAETHFYRLFFTALAKAALDPAESRKLINSIMN
jgi:hypothetical protein